MLFNSFTFFIFFFVFYFLYWLILNRNLKVQNILLLIGGYVFYSWTDWRRLKIIIVMYFILRLFLQRYKVADQSRVWKTNQYFGLDRIWGYMTMKHSTRRLNGTVKSSRFMYSIQECFNRFPGLVTGVCPGYGPGLLLNLSMN